MKWEWQRRTMVMVGSVIIISYNIKFTPSGDNMAAIFIFIYFLEDIL